MWNSHSEKSQLKTDHLIAVPDWLFLLAYLGLAIIGILVSMDHPFFWDGIQLGAKQAWWFYEQVKPTFFLPEAIDSGHPTFFPIYLAFCWKAFGLNLAVSHWAMAPFVFLAVFFSWRISLLYKEKGTLVKLFPLLLFLDPTFLSQLLQIGPDVALLAFFIMGLYAVLGGQKVLIFLAILGLGMISMRGMMCAFALFLFDVVLAFRQKELAYTWLWRSVLIYSPGVLVAIAYLLAHYWATGWLAFHANSPWAESFEPVGGTGYLRNTLVLIWRLLDFGRIFIWLALAGLWYAKGMWSAKDSLVLLGALLLLILSWPFIVYAGVNQHRYLLPLYVVLNLYFLLTLTEIIRSKRKQIILFCLVGGLLFSGNRWIYPNTIDQGWDSTLAHWPYYKLRKEAETFLKEKEISFSKVGTAFPAIGELKYRNPENQGPGFKAYDLEEDQYIFYSNVVNGFSDADGVVLESDWQTIFQKEKRGLRVIIFQSKKTIDLEY